MKIKQNKYTSAKYTQLLKNLGYIPEDGRAFQAHELFNVLPEKVTAKKTFINWKKETDFAFNIELFISGTWGYDLTNIQKPDLSDQAELDTQLTDLLAKAILYLHKYKLIPQP